MGDKSSLFYYSNRNKTPPQQLHKGIYGLSNHLLNTEWPKVKNGLDEFKHVISKSYGDPADTEESLLKLLRNNQQADDSVLPDTGVGKDIEKLLSSRFITSPGYGTRASTIVQIPRSGTIHFLEQNYIEGGALSEKVIQRL